jgi:hypothetical protein
VTDKSNVVVRITAVFDPSVPVIVMTYCPGGVPPGRTLGLVGRHDVAPATNAENIRSVPLKRAIWRKLAPRSASARCRPQTRMVNPSPANPTIQINMPGGNPPIGNLGKICAVECLMVETVRVELAGDDPSEVGEDGSNVQVAALGRVPQAKVTALLKPFEGDTESE